MVNDRILQIFGEIADLLELRGENVFRIRAYRRAMEVVRGMSDLSILLQKNPSALEGLPGIGPELKDRIREILATGTCEMHTRLAQDFPEGILDLLRLRGIGPKKVKLFWEKLGIHRLDQLKAAAESGALADLPGLGEKSQASILKSLEESSLSKARTPYAKALTIAESYLQYLRAFPGLERVDYAGSLRRQRESVGDIDLLAVGAPVPELMRHFVSYPLVRQILAEGETKSSVVLEGNVQVDFRVVEADSFGAALFYFTGPKQFNIDVRTRALKRGCKINEYGLFEGEVKRAGRTEEEMFEGLDLPYLAPPEREHAVLPSSPSSLI